MQTILGNCFIKAPPIQIETRIELTFGSSVALVAIALFMLHRFIQEYALSLLDRKNHVTNLSKINEDLQSLVKKYIPCFLTVLLFYRHKVDINLDLDTPITKVIRSIKEIQENGGLSAENMDNLNYVIEILSSNQLFLPDFLLNSTQAVDEDVSKWLNTMVMNQTTEVKKAFDVRKRPDGELEEILVKDLAQYVLALISDLYIRNEQRIQEILQKCDSWDFDIFELAEATMGRPLFYLGVYIFERMRFKQEWQIDDATMRKFFMTIETGYRSNPYHNSTHAADVMHAVFFFLETLELGQVLSGEDRFAAIVAAVIHDYDHPGQTNAFLINTSNSLALLYNDNAVLEHFHCAQAFEIILSEKNNCNIFDKLPKEKFRAIRSSILSTVLATDMAVHFEYIAKFKNKTNGAGVI